MRQAAYNWGCYARLMKGECYCGFTRLDIKTMYDRDGSVASQVPVEDLEEFRHRQSTRIAKAHEGNRL